MSPAPVFATARLRLEPLTPADVPAIVALHADPRVTPLLMDTVPATARLAEMFVDWARGHYAHGYGTFAARRHGDPVLAGLFSLTPFAGTDDLELGGKLAPGAWGRDLAVEAGAALVGHALAMLGRDRLLSAVHPGNRAAAAALARLGFVHTHDAPVGCTLARVHTLARAAWERQGSRPLGPREGRLRARTKG